MKSEIISVGTELLMGEITDTNASYLASQLPSLGIDLYWVSQVGDNRARLLEVLRRAWQRSELIMTTGGLGPTEDDLTRETIAEMLGEELKIDPASELELRGYFERRGVEMPPVNLKQAKLISSAKPVHNSQGTAPGWWVERDGRILVAMPGPPVEMTTMWQKEILPELRRRSTGTIILSKIFKTFGLSEPAVDKSLSALVSQANPTVGVYVKVDGVHVRLAAKAESRKKAEQMIADGEVSIRAILDKHIWGTDDDKLETVVGRLLVEKGLTLAIMEDFSSGWLTAGLSDIAGCSSFLKGGLVTCSNESKIALGIKPETISRYASASSELARAMAESARALLNADIGIGVSAEEETEAQTPGVVYVGIDSAKNGCVISKSWGKRRVITSALFGLRDLLITIDKILV